jgi:hypothetical protein
MVFKLGGSILPQPPSFNKKKNYEIHEVLGEGTFGKVAVSSSALALLDHPLTINRKRLGLFPQSKQMWQTLGLLLQHSHRMKPVPRLPHR